MKKIIFGSLLLCTIYLLVGCSDMNDKHDIYLQEGEIVYIGRVDSARVLAGQERFLLRYWITDPRAKMLKIYWSQKKDSMIVNIPAHQPLDSIDVLVGNVNRVIPEGNYTLQLISTNGGGLRSIVHEKIVNIYGNKFAATLLERLIKQVKMNAVTSDVTIDWAGVTSAKEVGIEFSYVDLSNVTIKKKLTTQQVGTQTILRAVDKTKGLTYRTMYLPEPTAIDTFFTSSKNIVVP